MCLVSCYPPSKGPLSEYTYHLAQNLSLSPKIAKITVLADKSFGGENYADGKIKVVRCWKLDDPLTPFVILRKIKQVKPDITQFNLLFRQFSANRLINFLGLCTPAAGKLFNMRVVVTLHSIAEAVDITEVGYENSTINRLGCRLATKLLLLSDVVTLPHRHFVEILREKYGAKNVVHVPHGVFHEPLASCRFEGKTLLLFGKMGPYKDPSLALEAFKGVLRNDGEAELVIAGSSHPLHPRFLESTLRKTGQISNIKIRGYVPENELETLFTSSVAVVLPYTITTWSSGVFHLACMYGRPVIASDLPDFRALRAEEAGILLFPKGDSQALTKKMDLLLHDRWLQKELGESNLKWARNHSFRQVADGLLVVFEKLFVGREPVLKTVS